MENFDIVMDEPKTRGLFYRNYTRKFTFYIKEEIEANQHIIDLFRLLKRTNKVIYDSTWIKNPLVVSYLNNKKAQIEKVTENLPPESTDINNILITSYISYRMNIFMMKKTNYRLPIKYDSDRDSLDPALPKQLGLLPSYYSDFWRKPLQELKVKLGWNKFTSKFKGSSTLKGGKSKLSSYTSKKVKIYNKKRKHTKQKKRKDAKNTKRILEK